MLTQFRARVLGDKQYGPNYRLKNLLTGEVIEASVAKRADIKMLLTLMAFRILNVIIDEQNVILNVEADRTTNRFYAGREIIRKRLYEKPKAAQAKNTAKKRECQKGRHIKGCKCPPKPKRRNNYRNRKR